MKILVINCGSSSIKFGLFVMDSTAGTILSGQVERIGEEESRLTYQSQQAGKSSQPLNAADHRQAFAAIFNLFDNTPGLAGTAPDAIGHRVVHGGELFDGPTRVDAAVLEKIRQLNPLAPLHNPVNLLGLEICAQAFPHTPQVAVFDTAFHQTLPPSAFRYAVPDSWYREQGIRRYGFHGSSHQYLARQAAKYLGQPAENLKLITLHLGNGASAAAIQGGRSLDTSMGFTPLEGLVMGSRSGDLDAMAALEAAGVYGLEQTKKMLTHGSGLQGLCGANDLREILAREAEGDVQASLAVEVYVYRIKKYIGAYFVALGGVDALVFSGGVGENSPVIRERVCQGLQCLNLTLNPRANQAEKQADIMEIQPVGKRPKILVIRTDEELEIASQTAALIASL
jgi:acetate kinase